MINKCIVELSYFLLEESSAITTFYFYQSAFIFTQVSKLQPLTQISSLPFSFLQRVASESSATVASDLSSAVRSFTITCMMRPRCTWASKVVLHGGYMVGFFCLYTGPFSGRGGGGGQ